MQPNFDFELQFLDYKPVNFKSELQKRISKVNFNNELQKRISKVNFTFLSVTIEPCNSLLKLTDLQSKNCNSKATFAFRCASVTDSRGVSRQQPELTSHSSLVM